MPSARFELDTQVTPDGPNRFTAQMDPGWWIVRGPNGGYIGAILVRALEATLGEPARQLRSITIHYLRPPAVGPVEIETCVERSGRSMSTLTARMSQGGKLQALAIAAFSTRREAAELHHAVMPEVAPPEKLLPRPDALIPIHEQFEHRVGIGPRFELGERGREAITGGWMRLSEPRTLDAAQVVAYSDAWPPAVFSTDDLERPTGGVPTVDLTVHLRAELSELEIAADEPVLVLFRTREVTAGFLEEDGELWSRSGVLLAQCRQLGVLL